MMNDLYSTRVQAPAYHSDPRNGSSELADLKPITGGFVEDGPLVRKPQNNDENSKKKEGIVVLLEGIVVLVGPRNSIWVGSRYSERTHAEEIEGAPPRWNWRTELLLTKYIL